MTIDEAIAHAREIASEQKRRSGICVQNNSECDKFSACLKCSEEHKQLAEWLEELKAFRENKWTDIYIKRGYDKAIDDFVENISLKISESIIWGMLVNIHKDNSFNDTSDKIVDYVINTSKEIAEQLKAGVKE